MFVLKRIGYRAFQLAFRVAIPFLPYREPIIVTSYDKAGEIFKSERSASVMIVTDVGIVKNQLLSPIERSLEKSGINYVIYDKTQPNPTVDNVEDAFSLYRENKCDSLFAIGGGSSIDCAKAVGARVLYPKRTLAQLGGKFKILKKLPTFVALPTTAGTGSEVTLAAVITEPKEHQKYALMSFPLIPHYAILDARITYSLPKHLTATTGMDALTHAVEAYIGRSTTKRTRVIAKNVVKIIFENIEAAYENGENHIARENMLYASYNAGIAFSISYVGYIHAISHSLSGRYGTPHGFANAIIMPYVLEGYGKSVYKKLYQLGMVVGVCDKGDSYEIGAKKFITAIKKLNERMGIPDKISDIEEKDIYEMAKSAEKEANPLYPVPKLMTLDELKEFYYKISKIDK